MPRAGWIKPETDQRLSDHLAIAMLTRAYPPELVDKAIAATGRLEERRRLLPARVVLYYVLAMALFNEASYEEVMRRLLEGLAWQDRWSQSWQLPTKAAIFKARARLGLEPMTELFRQAVHPLMEPCSERAWYRGRPAITIDYMEIELSGEGGAKGALTASGKLPLIGFLEQQTDVTLAIAGGESVDVEAIKALVNLGGKWNVGPLYLADERSATASLRSAAVKQGAALLWCSELGRFLEPTNRFSDGSGLVRLPATAPVEAGPLETAEHLEPAMGGPAELRLLPPADGEPPLLTTLVDPASAPADELRSLYKDRATLTSCLEELRVHQKAPAMVPRSKSSDSALQEVYGLLLTHYAIQLLFKEQEQNSRSHLEG